MKFVIAASNVKLFAKSILALSKLGDEIYVEPLNDSLTIRSVNSSRSAFACYSFKRAFFSYFEPELINKNRTNQADLNNTSMLNETTSRRANCDDTIMEETEPFKCKIPSKSLFSIFKNMNSLEKNVEKCTITVKYIPLNQDTMVKVHDYDSTMITKMINKNNEEQLYDTKFLIIMTSKFGLRKTFILSISDCENLQAAFLAENCSNKLNISAKYLHETINSFSNDTEEVTFQVEANKLTIKNYVEPDNSEAKSLINIQVNFDSDEFNQYEIEKELDITFCLKEFKICLLFGYWFDLPLSIYFQKKGRPIIFMYENSNSNYDVNFTLATLADDTLVSQSTLMSSNATTTANQTPSVSRSKTTSAEQLRKNLNNITNNNTKQPETSHNQPSLSKNLVEHKQTTTPKSNKRTLFDVSHNQIYLGDGPNENEPAHADTNLNEHMHDSADEDEMLTQALNEQEMTSMAVNSRKNNSHDQNPPPAKKIRSIVELFDEAEDDSPKAKSKNNDADKTNKNGISLADFLNMSSQDNEDAEDRDARKHTSIYVENTDSESE